jgi:hypothetical protein
MPGVCLGVPDILAHRIVALRSHYLEARRRMEQGMGDQDR